MRRVLRSLMILLLVVVVGLLSHTLLIQAQAPALPPDIKLETVAAGVTFPVSLRFAPDGRLFFTERFVDVEEPVTGTIRVLIDGRVQAEPFAVIDLPRTAPFAEKGVLGLALDPEFDSNGYVYTYRTAAATESIPREHGQVLRYTAVLAGANWVGTDMMVLIDNLPVATGCCHNGGILDFGPDAKLYVSIGEVGRQQSAQELNNRIGKILRFNPDGSVPEDNPFVNQSETDPAVYAYGLRNVFGFDWHPQTGEMFATDNGPNCDDELNWIVAGGNYGWPLSHAVGRCVDPGSGYIAPLLVFEPPPGLTNARFYTGRRLTAYTNGLFIGGWNAGALYWVDVFAAGDLEAIEVFTNCGQPVGDHNLVGIEPASDGSLYFSCQEEGFPAAPGTGAIYRLASRSFSTHLPLLRVSVR